MSKTESHWLGIRLTSVDAGIDKMVFLSSCCTAVVYAHMLVVQQTLDDMSGILNAE